MGVWFFVLGNLGGLFISQQNQPTKQKGKPTMSKEELMKIIEARKAWARGPKAPGTSSRQHNVSRSVPRVEMRRGETPEQALARAKSMGILG